MCFEMEMKKHAGLGTDAGAENIILAAFAKAVVGHVWCRENPATVEVRELRQSLFTQEPQCFMASRSRSRGNRQLQPLNFRIIDP